MMNEVIKDIDTGQAVPKPLPPKKPKAKKPLAILLLIVLIAGAGGGGYWWRDKDAKKAIEQKQSEITALQGQVTGLQEDLTAAKADAAKKPEATTGPSQATLDNVEQSISSGNTAALEGYLADKVLVIIAASEGVGMRTPAQAVSDVTDYIKDTKEPWDFSLPAKTVAEYSSGDYAQYFPNGALVGESADSMVISFTFNSSGKVSVIFLAADSALL